MIWRVGKVQDFDLGGGFIPSPGFTIQQEGRAPTLTLIFEDLKTAEQCASASARSSTKRRRSGGVISSCRIKAGCRLISRD
jgi:hypothetical protein